ncbi:MAG TPA: hypothetical protein VFV99_01580 [Kofleriaceae bacterium]|nr:hypothetical protein [Kofleriaceae bacterium]
MRRRKALALVGLLGGVLIAALVGCAFVIWRAPDMAALIAFGATCAAATTCMSLRHFGWLFLIVAVVYGVLAIGLYALHLLGLPFAAIVTGVAVLVVIILATMMWALIPAGTEDDPYDD